MIGAVRELGFQLLDKYGWRLVVLVLTGAELPQQSEQSSFAPLRMTILTPHDHAFASISMKISRSVLRFQEFRHFPCGRHRRLRALAGYCNGSHR